MLLWDMLAIHPNVSQIIGSKAFDDEMSVATTSSEADLDSGLKIGLFPKFNEVIWLLLDAGEEIERNLGVIIANLGLSSTRAAYQTKFLTNKEDALLDLRYEIAVTAIACAVFDKGTVVLEKPLPGKRKNSDVYGLYSGQAIRIEVTVLHENLEPVILDYILMLEDNLNIPVGCRVVLREIMTSDVTAKRITALVQLLYEHHVKTGGSSIAIDDVSFVWNGNYYHCVKGPFSQIELEASGGPRVFETEISHENAVRVRRITPRDVIEEEEERQASLPPWMRVVNVFGGEDCEESLSSKVRGMIETKLGQLENGIINIVALGVPRHRDDSEVVDAVLGGRYMSVYPTGDRMKRSRKAPFANPDKLNKDEEEQFIEPFRLLSALWMLRLSRPVMSKIEVNPNTSVPVPETLIAKLIK